MSTAVLLHVGAIAPLGELLTAIRNLQHAAVPFDLFVNLVRGRFDEAVASSLIKLSFPNATIVVNENRGMDIGGFLSLLPLVLNGSYDYILKLHTKSLDYWRRQLVAPICGTPSLVKNALRLFKTNPAVGLIAAVSTIYYERVNRPPNAHYLKLLAPQFGLTYSDFKFVGGTMFWVRRSLIERYFGGRDLALLQQRMNTPETLDPHWYMMNYRDLRMNTVELAEKHYRDLGSKAGRYRNCLDARDQGARVYLADGMIEHAYERLFGLMVKQAGLTILGV